MVPPEKSLCFIYIINSVDVPNIFIYYSSYVKRYVRAHIFCRPTIDGTNNPTGGS